MTPMHPLICLVGPSGSGKSSLIVAVQKAATREVGIVKSRTTRPERKDDPTEKTFYHFTSYGDLVLQDRCGTLLSLIPFNGHAYAFNKHDVNEVLREKPGLVAIVLESTFGALRKAGYTLVIVRVDPTGTGFKPRSKTRQKEEATHVYTSPPDLILENCFEEGGFDHAVRRLASFIDQL